MQFDPMISDRLSKDLRCVPMVPYVPLVPRGLTHWLLSFIYQNDPLVSIQYYHIHSPSPQAAPLTSDACAQSAGIATEADAGRN